MGYSLVSNDSRHGYADKLTEVVDRPHHRQFPFFFLAHKSKLYNVLQKYNTYYTLYVQIYYMKTQTTTLIKVLKLYNHRYTIYT